MICARYLLACFILFCFINISFAQQGDEWTLDFRRCYVAKPFDSGRVIFASGVDEGTVLFDVQWSDGQTLKDYPANPPILDIDGALVPLKGPPKDFYAYDVGTLQLALKRLSQGKHLYFNLGDLPERTVNIEMGDGKRAAEFLEMCAHYWPRFRALRDRFEAAQKSGNSTEAKRLRAKINSQVKSADTLVQDWTNKSRQKK